MEINIDKPIFKNVPILKGKIILIFIVGLLVLSAIFTLIQLTVSSQVKPATFRHKPYNILLLCNGLPMLESVAVACHV
jgi:hypothetical protein